MSQPDRLPPEKSAGKALKRIFRQDDILSRIEEQPASVSLLMNPIRREIFLHLCRSPCGHTRSITRSIGMSLTGVNWHLGQLLEHGYVEARELGGRKFYWPAGMMEETDIEIAAVLRQPWSLKIMEFVHRRNDGVRQKDIVIYLGMRQQNVNFWLGKMTSTRLLEKRGKRMAARYFIHPELAPMVEKSDRGARSFSKKVLGLLYIDGLMPKNPRFKGSRLGVDIKLPDGKIRLHFECSPLAPVRRFVSK